MMKQKALFYVTLWTVPVLSLFATVCGALSVGRLAQHVPEDAPKINLQTRPIVQPRTRSLLYRKNKL